MLFRQLVAVAAIGCLVCSTAHAQLKSQLPNENELNRLGLSLAWWGQASVKGSQEQVSFFSADEQNVYVQSASGIVTTFQGETGRRLWSQLVGMPNQQGYQVTSNETEIVIGVGMRVYAFNKSTGAPTLELTLPSPPSASPKEDDQFLYVPTVDGMLRSYDGQELRDLHKRGMLPKWTNRAERWRYQMPKASDSTPIPIDHEVVFSSKAGFLYRLNGESNYLRYQLEIGNPLSAPMTYSRNNVFLVDSRSRIVCVDIKTGQPQWTYSTGSPVRSQPRVVGNQLFASAVREGLVSINLVTGLSEWQQSQASDVIAVSEERVYANDDKNNLMILDRATGRVLAQMPLRDFTYRVFNDRTDRIYLAKPSGTVIALRELGSEYPTYHLYPERRPILPVLATEGDAAEAAQPADKPEKSEAENENENQ
ncbi:outer membrane protein assembly factor BamB family protein [Planctomicrobium sp. SH527]|uniref:outer membrane protein assembly factor BamB family protein n=1 Tax=Planctomicrobium sp. SH527 TaxID=3448123 RepID=UPI003F5CA4EC